MPYTQSSEVRKDRLGGGRDGWKGQFGLRQAAGDAGRLGCMAPRDPWESRTQLPRHRGQPGQASVHGNAADSQGNNLPPPLQQPHCW